MRDSIICMAILGLFITGCHKETEVSQIQKTELGTQNTEVLNSGAKIQFESTDCNLGNIGPRTMHSCAFRFKNTGNDILNITVTKGRGCGRHIVFQQSYTAGQSGTLEIPYNSGQRLGAISEPLSVTTNDAGNPKVTLTIKAVVEDKVYYEPRHIRLSLNEKNAGCPDIILVSSDERPFTVQSFTSTGGAILSGTDSSKKETQFILKPVVDTELLRKNLSGEITIMLTHPDCEKITILYEALPEFKVTPASLTLVNVTPGKSIERTFEVSGNYDESFEIDSAKSLNGFVKISEPQKSNKCYRFNATVNPPAKTGNSFRDTVILNLKDGRHIEIACIGFFHKK